MGTKQSENLKLHLVDLFLVTHRLMYVETTGRPFVSYMGWGS
jgi:hypothetical protein